MSKLNQLKQYIETSGWKPIEEAPRDIGPLLVKYENQDTNFAVWNSYHNGWCVASVQLGLMGGEWCDAYFDQNVERNGSDAAPTHFKTLDADMQMLEMAMEVVEKQRREHDSLLRNMILC